MVNLLLPLPEELPRDGVQVAFRLAVAGELFRGSFDVAFAQVLEEVELEAAREDGGVFEGAFVDGERFGCCGFGWLLWVRVSKRRRGEPVE